jgi:CheY-like chemotaxis protein
VTWLLAEDDNDIRNVVAVMLSVWGEKPLPFVDGNAAWAWLDSVDSGAFTGELPDLALLDIRMPGHTGDRVAARIRQTRPIKDIPIILMTAFSLTDAEVKAMIEECGIDLLINKPLPDMDIFRSTLYRVRDERRAMNVARLAQLRAQSAVPAPAPPPTPSAQPAAAKPTPPAPQTATPQPPTPAAQPAAAKPTPPAPQTATPQPPTPAAQPAAAKPTPPAPQTATPQPPTPSAQPPATKPMPPAPQTAATQPPTPSVPSQPAKPTPPQSAQPSDKDQQKKMSRSG